MDLLRKKAVLSPDLTLSSLTRHLGTFDLILLGIGAIIGAGVFVLTGIVAAKLAGPAIIFSFVLAGMACLFAALSYAELAACIGGCGSAYGYAYAGFGELIAWIVGWDLLLEYSISVSAVSVGWSGYFNDLLRSLDLNLPSSLIHAPEAGGILNVLSLLIILLLTALLFMGTKSSARVNACMVAVKLFAITVFIAAGIRDVQVEHWIPFMPFGWKGIVQGGSLIFFAYIGFDAVSTMAEETRNPQRDLPWGILGSLLICTAIYMIVAAILTGMVPYTALNVPSPISHALLMLGHRFAAGLIGMGAVAGLTTVMLVLFWGLTRIFFAMSRDGLLPAWFAHIHPVTKAPTRIILVCGLIMAGLSAFLPLDCLAELVNIGTLFAFIVVCSGVIVLRYTRPELSRPFKTPGMPWIPGLGILSCLYLMFNLSGISLLRFVLWMGVGLLIYFFWARFSSHQNIA